MRIVTLTARGEVVSVPGAADAARYLWFRGCDARAVVSRALFGATLASELGTGAFGNRVAAHELRVWFPKFGTVDGPLGSNPLRRLETDPTVRILDVRSEE